MGSNLKMIELGVSNPLVTGNAANIFLRRYMPAMPNIGLEETCSQPSSSAFSIADHCFISSEIGGIFGRSRIVRRSRFCGFSRFVFLALITQMFRQAWVWDRREGEAASAPLGIGLDREWRR